MSTPTGPRHCTHTKTADPADATARQEAGPDAAAAPVEPTAGRTPTAAPAAARWAVLLALGGAGSSPLASATWDLPKKTDEHYAIGLLAVRSGLRRL